MHPHLLPALALTAALATASTLHAQTISGVDDEETYDNRATFTVEDDPAATVTATLNGQPVAVGTQVLVDRMDFYELVASRTPDAGGATTTATVRFIVLHDDRGRPQTGLPKWTPYPLVPSTAAELAEARLDIVAPSNFPAGLEVPVVAWLRHTATDNAVRANGHLTADGHPDFALKILRGTGSAFLPPATGSGTIDLPLRLGPLAVDHQVTIDTTTTWTTAAGTIDTDTAWPAGARVHLTGDLTIPAANTLTVGPGAVVKIDPDVNITVDGHLDLQGTLTDPVVFLPADGPVLPEQSTNAWGGFILEGDSATLTATAAIIVGGGADDDWDFGDGDSHRDEQPVFFAHDGAAVTLTDSAVLNTAGQVGNGYNSDLTFRRTLLQRAITAGEYVGGSVRLEHSAVIEFPHDDGFVDEDIADADHDAIYFTRGTHFLHDTLIGFCKDDAIDAGSGGAGSVDVQRCWIESSLHEAMAWSGTGRVTTTSDTVAINNGQGFECGWSGGSGTSPLCTGTRLLLTANAVGARYGDNYDWDYDGRLDLTGSLVLHNLRDVFGYNWDDWTYRTADMDVRGNHLTAASAEHPDNTVWDPAAHAALLEPFMSTPPAAPVGVGLAAWGGRAEPDTATGAGIPVRLSSFTTQTVTVAYDVWTPAGGTVLSGTLTFPPGKTVTHIPVDPAQIDPAAPLVRIALRDPSNAEITGTRAVYLTAPENAPGTLVARGSTWKYHDLTTAPDPAWNTLGFDDTTWPAGSAELGDGDGGEATEIDIGPDGDRTPTLYFRHTFDVPDPAAFTSLDFGVRRDDGAVVYLNGTEVYRDPNVPEDAGHDTFTTAQTPSETDYEPFNAPAALLIAGANTIAVEVHQRDEDSSDISFDLELSAASAPRLHWTTFGDTHVLHWDDPAATLETTPNLAAPWVPLSTGGPYEFSPDRPSQFFRLRSGE